MRRRTVWGLAVLLVLACSSQSPEPPGPGAVRDAGGFSDGGASVGPVDEADAGPPLSLPGDGGFFEVGTFTQREKAVLESPHALFVTDDQNFKVMWVRDGRTEWQIFEAGLSGGRPFLRVLYHHEQWYMPNVYYLPNGDVLLGGMSRHEDPSLGTYVWLREDGSEAELFVCANTPRFAAALSPDGTMRLAPGYCRRGACDYYSSRLITLRPADGGVEQFCSVGDPAAFDFMKFNKDGSKLLATQGYRLYDVELDGGTMGAWRESRCQAQFGSTALFDVSKGDRLRAFVEYTPLTGSTAGQLGIISPAKDGGCDIVNVTEGAPPSAMAINGGWFQPFAFREGLAYRALTRQDAGQLGIVYFNPTTYVFEAATMPDFDPRGHPVLYSDAQRIWTAGRRTLPDGGWQLLVRRVVEVEDW